LIQRFECSGKRESDFKTFNTAKIYHYREIQPIGKYVVIDIYRAIAIKGRESDLGDASTI